jgi:hypothetical protein
MPSAGRSGFSRSRWQTARKWWRCCHCLHLDPALRRAAHGGDAGTGRKWWRCRHELHVGPLLSPCADGIGGFTVHRRWPCFHQLQMEPLSVCYLSGKREPGPKTDSSEGWRFPGPASSGRQIHPGGAQMPSQRSVSRRLRDSNTAFYGSEGQIIGAWSREAILGRHTVIEPRRRGGVSGQPQ